MKIVILNHSFMYSSTYILESLCSDLLAIYAESLLTIGNDVSLPLFAPIHSDTFNIVREEFKLCVMPVHMDEVDLWKCNMIKSNALSDKG